MAGIGFIGNACMTSVPTRKTIYIRLRQWEACSSEHKHLYPYLVALVYRFQF